MSAVKLKICGIKSVDEAKLVRDLDIDYLGLNFIPSSSRYLSLDMARAIVGELKGSGAKIVGLFAGQPIEELNEYVRHLKLDYVQLHGDEPADYARTVKTSVMRAIAIDPEQPADELIDFINHYPADYFVLDRQLQGRGQSVNLDFGDTVIKGTDKPVFFAGGLTPDNLTEVLAKIQPYGIDIAGGVRVNNKLDIIKVQACLKLLDNINLADG